MIKYLLLLLYLQNGQKPVMEQSFHENEITCTIAGRIRIDEIKARDDKVLGLWAGCLPVEAIQVERKTNAYAND